MHACTAAAHACAGAREATGRPQKDLRQMQLAKQFCWTSATGTPRRLPHPQLCRQLLQFLEDARQHIADYSSLMRVLCDHPAITSTSLCVIDMPSTTSTTRWRIDDNSQYGQYLLVID